MEQIGRHREVVGLRSRSHLRIGEVVPRFEIPELHSPRVVTAQRLTNYTLVFLSPTDDEDVRTFRRSIGYLFRRAAEKLCIVCLGTSSECGAIFPTESTVNGPFIVGVDEDGKTAQAFGVHKTPMAVRLDASSRIAGYGVQRE